MTHVPTTLTDADIDAVLTHEHLHLLQHRSNIISSKNVHDLKELYDEKYSNHTDFTYLTQRVEVEARLHEIVISYWRIHRELPLTIDGFLQMLYANKDLGEVFPLMLEIMGIKNTPATRPYHTREPMFAKGIRTIVVCMKSYETSCRYIIEVLTVMYGNLLHYYGDLKKSQDFLSKIERPNLYDKLYY